jgi:hypothetical protein
MLAAVAAIAPSRQAVSEYTRTIPASMRFEREQTIAQLAALAGKPAPVGPEARAVLDLLETHNMRHEAAVLPTLALLPLIAEGKASPDMKWALSMADRVKAERQQDLGEQQEITVQLNRLGSAAQQANDPDAFRTAQQIAGDLLRETEVTEPTAILIGEYLRAKLSSGS